MELENKIITEPNIRKRVFAGIIDYLIIYIYFHLTMTYFGIDKGDGIYTLNGLPAISVILFWFFITVGMEQFSGATIGNYLNKLKPISIIEEDDTIMKISFSQSVKRHLLDMIDMSMFGLIGILIIKNTDKNQRLGDLWAKTTVVKTLTE